MLAYVFWHRPAESCATESYETALRRFHDALDLASTSFRLRELPFAKCSGYEDWYLVEDWQALGALNGRAVDPLRRTSHDSVARLAAAGWGGVYALLYGAGEPPAEARWIAKPATQSYAEFLTPLQDKSAWQRQMVLGPAAEFCINDGGSEGRDQLFPFRGNAPRR